MTAEAIATRELVSVRGSATMDTALQEALAPPASMKRRLTDAEQPRDEIGRLTVLPVVADEPEGSELSAEAIFTALYVAEYARLLRLAALLLDDLGSCEEIVQEAYIKVHAALTGPTSRLREEDRALAYLRQTVVNLARSSLRRRLVARKHAPHPMPDAPSAEEGAYAQVERTAVVQALRGLPRREREAVVLRYYGDLTEAAAAHVMGVSTGAVKAYTSRGLAGLKLALEELR